MPDLAPPTAAADDTQKPLIYVVLIEDRMLTMEEFIATGAVITKAKYQSYTENFQPWRLLVKSGDNHRDLFRSTESYYNRADAEHAADIAFGPNSDVYLRHAEQGDVPLRLAQAAA
jgi:hypothetical protein